MNPLAHKSLTDGTNLLDSLVTKTVACYLQKMPDTDSNKNKVWICHTCSWNALAWRKRDCDCRRKSTERASYPHAPWYVDCTNPQIYILVVEDELRGMAGSDHPHSWDVMWSHVWRTHCLKWTGTPYFHVFTLCYVSDVSDTMVLAKMVICHLLRPTKSANVTYYINIFWLKVTDSQKMAWLHDQIQISGKAVCINLAQITKNLRASLMYNAGSESNSAPQLWNWQNWARWVKLKIHRHMATNSICWAIGQIKWELAYITDGWYYKWWWYLQRPNRQPKGLSLTCEFLGMLME